MYEKVRITTGINNLDALIQGGFLKGSINLVIGPAGAGKTIFGLHYLFEGAKRGENGLLIAMQEPPWAIRRDGSNLKFFNEEFLTGSEKITMADFTPSGWELWDPDSFELSFDEELEGVNYDEVSLPAFLHKVFFHISQVVEEKKIDRLVIDPIAAVQLYGFDEKSAWFTRKITTSFLANIASLNVTSLIISEVADTNQSTLFGEDYICDTTIHLDMLSVRGEMVRILRINKMRGTAHTRKTLRFEITTDGIVFLDPED